MKPHQRLLCVGVWINDFAAFLFMFAVGRALAEGDAGLMVMGMVGGGLALVMAVASLLFGHVADRASQRWMISIASIMLAVSPIGYLMTENVALRLYGWYWLSAVALGMIYPPVYAWLSAGDRGGGHRRGATHTIIWFCMAWNLGIICGNLVGGWQFEAVGPLAPIWLAAALAALNVPLWQLAARWRRLAMIEQGAVGPDAAASDVDLLASRQRSSQFVKLAWLANLGGAFSMSVVMHLFHDLAVRLDVPSDQQGMIVGLSRGVVILTYVVMWRSVFWHWRFGAALASQLLGAVGMLCVAMAQDVLGLMVGLTLLAQLVGFNYFASLYYSTDGSDHARRGGAMGLHEATLGLGFAAGSMLGGYLAEAIDEPRLPYYLGAAVILFFAVCQVLLHGISRRGEADRVQV